MIGTPKMTVKPQGPMSLLPSRIPSDPETSSRDVPALRAGKGLSRRAVCQSLLVSAGMIAGVFGGPSPAWAGQNQRRTWPARRRTPAVQLPLLEGGATWDLGAQKGQAVLLHFWATWCEPCREELPALAQRAQKDAERGLRVLAVDYREPEATVRRFFQNTPGLSPQALTLAVDRDGSVAKAFDVRVFPSTVAIDRQGRARFVVMGAVDWMGAEGQALADEILGH
jgi:thiol-disulfide isomerase/thioredoxin